MSAETKTVMEAAIQAHITDEANSDELVTGYILCCSTTSFDSNEPNRHNYWFEGVDNQPSHVTRGLASLLEEWATGALDMQEDE